MSHLDDALEKYAAHVAPLARTESTTEPSYYPPIRSLLAAVLKSLGLQDDVRVNTLERRSGGGSDQPDVALYDDGGDFVVLCGEVKAPDADLTTLAQSTVRNDQIGRYLAQTQAVLLSNVRAFGLVITEPEYDGDGPVPPEHRRLEGVSELWSSELALKQGERPHSNALVELRDLVEYAVTSFAPIAEPETLARILALQAKRAKAGLPKRFSQAVETLADDFGTALGITFEGEEGEEFFRSSLVQTVYYSVFAGWILWARSGAEGEFNWRDLSGYLKIPFLGELFYEIQHPTRIAELDLVPRLNLASNTLERVNRKRFFDHLELPALGGTDDDPERAASTAIIYFYEPFLETFDPSLRKELGVWYTPPEIVRYQVRKVEHLLRSELKCPRGFADERVVVLDPGCGTGAYLIEIMTCMAERLRDEGVEAELGASLLQAVRERIYGFEILTAPFVVAHLQIRLLLASLEVEPASNERPGVFLTNSLTGWSQEDQIRLHFPELQEEHDAAHRVKTEAPIIVILGNPPYNRFAGAPVEEERSLIDPYKGIERDAKGRQTENTDLYERWGIRKHLLDDLYIRFFRLAEDRIGGHAEHGIVSYISNSSYLTGRSHPLMREYLLSSFHDLWIDKLNGDKYKTGKIIPEGHPGAGSSDQSIFSTPQNPGGIQVGTAVATLLKRNANPTRPGKTPVKIRDFWGLADDKRKSLVASLNMSSWSEQEISEAGERPEGPREYHEFHPQENRRWKLVPYKSVGGYDEWPSLDQLFPISFMGVHTGKDDAVVAATADELKTRISDYRDPSVSDEEIASRHPALMKAANEFDDPSSFRQRIQREEDYDPESIIRPYLYRPMDSRYIWYDTKRRGFADAEEPWSGCLVQRYGKTFKSLVGIDNCFLCAVSQPRRRSESKPMIARSLIDLHLHDRGTTCFPAFVRSSEGSADLFSSAPADGPKPNLESGIWATMSDEWGLSRDDQESERKAPIQDLFLVVLAIGHSPEYQEDHQESLAHAWARIPVPKKREKFARLSELGSVLGILLDPFQDARQSIDDVIGPQAAASLAKVVAVDCGSVRRSDLRVEISYYGSAKGKWTERSWEDGDCRHPLWGKSTGDLYLNDRVYLGNVPKRVWGYELGGFPVISKWLGYRHTRFRGETPLTLQEKDQLREIVQRIAAIRALEPELDAAYRDAASSAFSVEELLVDAEEI